MRRILGVAAILTGVASVSAAETSYRACGKDGQLAFFSFTEAGNFVEIKILGSEIEPFIRPANSALLIEVEEDVLVFGDDMVTLIQGSKLTQLDCYSMNAKYVAAFNAEASEMAAELERLLLTENEMAVELSGQLAEAEQLLAQANLQIDSLTDQLNTALARVASEEQQRRALEEAEKARRNFYSFKSETFRNIGRVLAGQERIQIGDDRFVFSSEVLFEAARADLSDEGRAELAKLAAILRTISDEIPSNFEWIIRVDGHTDNVPMSGGGLYRNNWELSQARALSVLMFFEQQGIDPRRLSANGFGEYQPINRDDTPQARAQNRRIEIRLTER